jgi:hypothetical protein
LFYFMFLCESGSCGTPLRHPILASSNNLNRIEQRRTTMQATFVFAHVCLCPRFSTALC